ncbi:MAG: 4Fe-4S dicluster domain-containing protein [Lentisphaerae bacterium]|nr:4Fe-4S dicluster domain-containing protein [Lentisphaerota bacterium]
MKKHFRVTIDRELCKGCELCIGVCPLQLLSMTATLNRKGYHAAETSRAKECSGCLKCARMCPEAVIEIWNEQ